MNGLLMMDPTKRLTGLEAMTHPYFDDIRFKDSEFFKITEGDQVRTNDATRPIQSSQGPIDKIDKHTFEEKRNSNMRAGVTAYSGFDSSSIKDIPLKRKQKKDKTKKINAAYGKRTLYDDRNGSLVYINEKTHTFGKPKYSNGSIKSKEILNIYGNGDLGNTQYTSRNDEANISNTFLKSK